MVQVFLKYIIQIDLQIPYSRLSAMWGTSSQDVRKDCKTYSNFVHSDMLAFRGLEYVLSGLW